MNDKDQVRSTDEALSLEQTLRLALEALERVNVVDDDCDILAPSLADAVVEAITTIKAALSGEAQQAKDEPVQVSPLQFVEMVMEKEDCVGKPIIWAEWPNKEKT